MTERMSRREFFGEMTDLREQLANERIFALSLQEFPPAERLRRCEKDVLEFARVYLPHYAGNKPAKLHADTSAQLSRTGLSLILWPRGFGKTTFCDRIDLLHKILYGKTKFSVIISETEYNATLIVSSVRWELEDNPRILADFGRQKGVGVWSDREFITASGIRVLARGYGQQIRGISNREARPDHIIIDDLESERSARNPRVVQQKLDWLQRAVLPARSPQGRVVIIGTILCRHSLIDRIAGEKGLTEKFFISRYPAIIRDAIGRERSTWPDRFPLSTLAVMRQEMGEHAWAAEMMHLPIDDSLIKAESFRRGEPQGSLFTVGYIDPAMGGRRGDYTAIIIASQDSAQNVYVREAWIRRAGAPVTASALALLGEKYHPVIVGIEANGFQTLFAERMEAKILTPLIEIKTKESKDVRIMRLAALVERGRVYLPEVLSPDLEELLKQCIYYPASNVNDDGPDALAGAIELISGRRRGSRGIVG